MKILNEFPFTFYGELFKTYYCDDGNFWLPLNDVCEHLGVDDHGQRQRIQRNPAISDALANLVLPTTYQDTVRMKEVACLNLKRLPYWLGTIDAMRINEEHRDQVILYQREFADAAWAVFRSDILPPDILAETDAYLSPDQQKIHHLMDQAREIMHRIDLLQSERGKEIERVESRLGRLESFFEDKVFINNPQALIIRDMVGELAMRRFKGTSMTKGQSFQKTWGELYQRFQVPSYKLLEEHQYDEARDFLRKKWVEILGDEPMPPCYTDDGYQPNLI